MPFFVRYSLTFTRCFIDNKISQLCDSHPEINPIFAEGGETMIYGSWVLTSFVICNILLILMTAIGYYFQAKNDKDNG